RRPVDFEARERALGELDTFEDFGDPFDNRLKALVTRRLLLLRRTHPALFASGKYQPLEVVGEHATHVVAFERTEGGRSSWTIASRITAIAPSDGKAQWWRDTAIKLSDEDRHKDLTCHISQHRVHVDGGLIRVADALEKLPVAVLVN